LLPCGRRGSPRTPGVAACAASQRRSSVSAGRSASGRHAPATAAAVLGHASADQAHSLLLGHKVARWPVTAIGVMRSAGRCSRPAARPYQPPGLPSRPAPAQSVLQSTLLCPQPCSPIQGPQATPEHARAQARRARACSSLLWAPRSAAGRPAGSSVSVEIASASTPHAPAPTHRHADAPLTPRGLAPRAHACGGFTARACASPRAPPGSRGRCPARMPSGLLRRC